MENMIIPKGVLKIRKLAFYMCWSLKSISIPNTVTVIEKKAFTGCNALKDIYYSGTEDEWQAVSIEEDNKPIENATVHFAYEVDAAENSSVELDETELANQNGKIIYCDGKSEDIKYGITKIADNLYRKNKNVFNVILPVSIKKIGAGAFYGCDNLEKITLPDGLTSIGNAAFESCTSLSEINIPATVTEIGNNPFIGCDINITILPGNKHFAVKDKSLYTFDNSKIISYIPQNGESDFTLPESVTEIGSNSFYRCTALRGLELTCVSHIGENAFYGCENLKSLILPTDLSNVEWNAFHDCYSLQDIHYGGSQKQWRSINIGTGNERLTGANIIYSKYDIENIYGTESNGDGKIIYKNGKEEILKNGVTRITKSTFKGKNDITAIVLPRSVKSIKGGLMGGAFAGCDKLESVVLPEGLTEIGQSAFQNCSKLKNVNIPESVTNIEWGAFEGCSSLQSIRLNKNLTKLGAYAFSDCTMLSNVKIEAGVGKIGGFAFAKCSSLKEITLPETVKIIEVGAFTDCSSLIGIVLPKSLTKIEVDTFKNCSTLQDIYYRGSDAEWKKTNIYSTGNEKIKQAKIHYNYKA
jgi:hypothetical protein